MLLLLLLLLLLLQELKVVVLVMGGMAYRVSCPTSIVWPCPFLLVLLLLVLLRVLVLRVVHDEALEGWVCEGEGGSRSCGQAGPMLTVVLLLLPTPTPHRPLGRGRGGGPPVVSIENVLMMPMLLHMGHPL